VASSRADPLSPNPNCATIESPYNERQIFPPERIQIWWNLGAFMRQIHLRRTLTLLLLVLVFCAVAALAQADTTIQTQAGSRAEDTGISGLWVLANVSFAGMRAQNNRSMLWRALAFFFGFPGTLVTFLAVAEGSDRAYGIDIPRRSAP
jgi:hypothetical protein